MKGLEFFYSRIKGDFSSIEMEKELGFNLPYMFKLFLSLYEVGEDNISTHVYLNPKFNKVTQCGIVLFKPSEEEEYGFDGFYNESKLIDDFKSYSFDSEEFVKYGLIRIASINTGGGIFIGTNEANSDKIYLVNWSKDEDYELIAENIFEFSKKLFFREEEVFLNLNESYSDLYKKWGEDFWRVRE